MTTWTTTTEKKYWYALEVLPPAIMLGGAFMVGEPDDHRTCSVTGHCLPRYAAYAEKGGKFYYGGSMTVPEFKKAIREVV